MWLEEKDTGELYKLYQYTDICDTMVTLSNLELIWSISGGNIIVNNLCIEPGMYFIYVNYQLIVRRLVSDFIGFKVAESNPVTSVKFIGYIDEEKYPGVSIDTNVLFNVPMNNPVLSVNHFQYKYQGVKKELYNFDFGRIGTLIEDPNDNTKIIFSPYEDNIIPGEGVHYIELDNLEVKCTYKDKETGSILLECVSPLIPGGFVDYSSQFFDALKSNELREWAPYINGIFDGFFAHSSENTTVEMIKLEAFVIYYEAVDSTASIYPEYHAPGSFDLIAGNRRLYPNLAGPTIPEEFEVIKSITYYLDKECTQPLESSISKTTKIYFKVNLDEV